jgi:hypothetical protein
MLSPLILRAESCCLDNLEFPVQLASVYPLLKPSGSASNLPRCLTWNCRIWNAALWVTLTSSASPSSPSLSVTSRNRKDFYLLLNWLLKPKILESQKGLVADLSVFLKFCNFLILHSVFQSLFVVKRKLVSANPKSTSHHSLVALGLSSGVLW